MQGHLTSSSVLKLELTSSCRFPAIIVFTCVRSMYTHPVPSTMQSPAARED